MNRHNIYVICLTISAATLSACSPMRELAQDVLTPPATRQQQVKERFEEQQAEIESRADMGKIPWTRAVQETRNLDKSYATRYSNVWKYSSDDEEYYAYCLQLAERLDAKRISYAQFDAARIQRKNQIDARRQQLNQQNRQTELQQQNQKLLEQQQRQAQEAQNRPLNCTSSAIGGQIYTTCH